MYWPKIRSNINDWDQVLSEMNRLFSGVPSGQTAVGGSPKLNAWAKKDAVAVTAEVPGIKPEEIKISAHENKLTLEGEFKGRNKTNEEVYHRCECSNGKFRRELTLPFKIDSSKVSASCKNGILQINVPRAEEDKPKTITVKPL